MVRADGLEIFNKILFVFFSLSLREKIFLSFVGEKYGRQDWLHLDVQLCPNEKLLINEVKFSTGAREWGVTFRPSILKGGGWG